MTTLPAGRPRVAATASATASLAAAVDNEAVVSPVNTMVVSTATSLSTGKTLGGGKSPLGLGAGEEGRTEGRGDGDAAAGAAPAFAGDTVWDADGVLVPTEFVADTLNQYAWPLVRPVMVFVVAVLPVLATATAKPADALVVDCSIL